MKKVLALFLVLALLLPILPRSARADSSLRPEIETFGSVDAAMDAYAERMLRPYSDSFRAMTQQGVLAFRTSVDKVYQRQSHDDEPNRFMEALVTIGFTVTENDNRWLLSENQIELDLKYLLMLAQMENLPFEDAAEQVQSYMPDYNLGAAAFGVAADVFVNLLGGKLAEMMKTDALVFGPSLTLASKTMKEGGVASRTLFKAMDTVVANYDAIFSGANAMVDSAKALSAYTQEDAALVNLVNSYNQVLSGRSLVSALLASGKTDAEMTTACNILLGSYDVYLDDLNSMGSTAKLNQKLRSESYLTDRFNELLSNALAGYSNATDVIAGAAAGALTLLDIWQGGWGTIILKGGTNVAGEFLFGTTSTYTHFHAMATLDEIYAAIEEQAGMSLNSWEDHIAYARTIQRLCNIALLGETQVYQMAAQDEGAGQKLWNLLEYVITGKDNEAIYDAWYQQRVEFLHSVYNGAEEYIAALYEHWDRLNLQTADVSDLLGYEHTLTATITGEVVEDEWYALPDGSGPNRERPNPDAGEPVADLPVHLVANGEVIASGSTDGSGRYSITYPLHLAQDADLSLTMGDDQTVKYIVKENVSTINYPGISFRSSFRFNADTESPADLSPAQAQFELPYADDYFLASSYEYNHNLALASLGLAAASMSDPSADGSWTVSGSVGRDGNIRAAWSAIGYQTIISSGYDGSLNELADAPAYTIATRTFTDPDARKDEPETYRIVGVAIRGDVDAPELAHSLMTAESGSSYQGSAREAAMTILVDLENVIIDASEEDVPMMVWVTGFSRGGTVAGQLCDLIRLRSSLNSRISGLFGYTFGAAAASTDSYSASTSSSGVFNIVYGEDLVATGMLAALRSGYARPAHTFTFGPADAQGYAQRRIASAFSVLTNGNTSYDPAAYAAGTDTLAFLDELWQTASSSVYAKELQPFVTAIMQLAFLRDDTGSDFRTLSLQDKHRQVLSMLGYDQAIAGPIAYDGSSLPAFTLEQYRANMLEGIQATFFAALPQDMQDNLNSWLDDILQLAARQTGAADFALDEDVQHSLLSLALTLSDDFSNPTCLASSLYGHHPEIYMAWMLGSSGALFEQDEPLVFNTRILPVEMNLMGVVLEAGKDKPLAGVQVTAASASGAVKTAVTKEDGTWEMYVKPDDVTVHFTLAGYEPAREHVSKAALEADVVELTTYMSSLPAAHVVITTDSYIVEGSHYQATILKPIVWSDQNPNLTAAVDKAISPIFEEAMDDAADMIRNHSCSRNVRAHTTHAYMDRAWATDGMVQIVIQDGYFHCDIGHNVNTSTAFVFDIATGKRLTLDDIFNPENPEAKNQFLDVLTDLIRQTDGKISASATKVYNQVRQHKYSTWYFLADGIYFSFDFLETGWFSDLFIPYEMLQGVLHPDYMPSEHVGFGVYSRITEPAPTYDDVYLLYENAPCEDNGFAMDGLTTHLWVDNYRTTQPLDTRGRYFYAYKLKDAKVWLPEADDQLYVRWIDSTGEHTQTLPIAK